MSPIEFQTMSDRDLLVQCVTVVNGLQKKLDELTTSGLPQCAIATERHDTLRKRVGTVTKTAYAVGLLFIADLVGRVAWK